MPDSRQPVSRQQIDTTNDAIAPASVTLNATPNPPGKPPTSNRKKLGLWLGLGGSLLVAGYVVLVLPQQLTHTPSDAGSAESAPVVNPAPAATPPAQSPWSEAQRARARRQTQDLLAQLLDRQESLEAKQVQQWAAADYQAALALAETADGHYRQEAYPAAINHYQQALQAFNQLLERQDTVFQQTLERGEQALAEGNAELAAEQFQLALALSPDSDPAQQGLARSETLEQVLALTRRGEQETVNGELDAARDSFQQALALDDQARQAQQGLADVEQQIRDRDFGRHMANGFAALDRQEFPQASRAFQQALQLKPQANDAQAALRQAQNQQSQAAIEQQLARAAELEAAEQWTAARDAYQSILQQDDSVVAARVGELRSATRAEMAERLGKILEDPLQLSDPAVHRSYQAFYEELQQLPAGSQQWQSQIEALGEALTEAQQPVTVTLRSDNATQVTVYRVGELGRFASTQLTLTPGRYTAVGSREGYRDVRREFTVTSDAEDLAITIQCEEPING